MVYLDESYLFSNWKDNLWIGGKFYNNFETFS